MAAYDMALSFEGWGGVFCSPTRRRPGDHVNLQMSLTWPPLRVHTLATASRRVWRNITNKKLECKQQNVIDAKIIQPYGERMNITEYLERENMSRAKFASRIGVSPTTVLYWQTGKRNPSPGRARLVEEITGGAVTRAELRPDVWDLA